MASTAPKLPLASGSKAGGSVESVYSIKVPKNISKRYHVMRFNKNLGVDFTKWSQVKMERENNMKEFKGIDEDMPKFGAGSEFGREAKEEARRKKLGIISRKYKADDQPWILKSYGSTVKKFKGIREGGVSENASFYVFTQCANGAIEAFPLHEWYKFQPIQRYKALTAEEAETEFNKRNKHLNFFSLMLRKRLKGDEDADLEDGEEGKVKKSGKKTKELTISEMDEWMDSSEGDSSDEEGKREEEEDDKNEKKKKAKKTAIQKKKKKNRDTDGEAFEESDDGDDEGRELDYISDSSDSEPEETKLEGVAEEKALRKLLTSDEDSDDSDKSDKEDKKEEDENAEKDGENKEESPEKEKKKSKKKSKKKDAKKEVKKEKNGKESDNSDFSSDSSTDEDVKKQKAAKKSKKASQEDNKDAKDKDPNGSKSDTPHDSKRKLINDIAAGTSAKKPKLDMPLSNYIPGSAESGITEDAVRKYLMRKPMTTTELLQKFKAKKTGLSSEQLVNIMTQILKKINPVKQTLKGKMYLSIKS